MDVEAQVRGHGAAESPGRVPSSSPNMDVSRPRDPSPHAREAGLTHGP